MVQISADLTTCSLSALVGQWSLQNLGNPAGRWMFRSVGAKRPMRSLMKALKLAGRGFSFQWTSKHPILPNFQKKTVELIFQEKATKHTRIIQTISNQISKPSNKNVSLRIKPTKHPQTAHQLICLVREAFQCLPSEQGGLARQMWWRSRILGFIHNLMEKTYPAKRIGCIVGGQNTGFSMVLA